MLVFTNLGVMEFHVRCFVFFLLSSVIDSFTCFRMGSLHKNIQLMLEILKAPFLVLHLLLYINDFPDNVICDITVNADNTTLYSKCDLISDLWQQLKLASKLESDLQDTVDWSKKWLVDFNAGKTELALFDRYNNTGSTDLKMDGSVLEE